DEIINKKENLIQVKEISKDSDKIPEKIVKINGETVKATIKISLSSNIMSIRYAKEKGLTWKCSNQGDKIVGYVSSVKDNVNSIKMVEKFYIKRIIASDIILRMLWVVRSRESEFVDIRHVEGELRNYNMRKNNRIVSMMNEKNINEKGSKRENIPDIQRVSDENLKAHSREINRVNEIEANMESSKQMYDIDKWNQNRISDRPEDHEVEFGDHRAAKR
ncbi:18839_t:CDS:2, partial [Gigaspora margarita]